MNKFTYIDFYNQWLNQSSNLGGNYNQCVTLFKEFLRKAGYPNPGRAIGGSGGAREIWYRRNALGYGDYFEFTQIGRPGDWFIWDSVYGWWQGVYYGHVAMLIKDNGNGTGQFLGMNQSYSQAPAQVMTLTYNGSCGVLRYKGYGTQASTQSVTTYNANNLIAEHAIATLTIDSVAIRQGSPSGNVLSRQNKGYQFEYYYKTVANGHRWVINKDKTQFMAISGSEQQGKDLWATFSAIEANTEPSKPSGTITLTEEHAIATLTVDGVRARLNSPTGDVVRTYNAGDKIEYTHKYVGNGHRYIVWTEGNNKIFLAISGTEDRTDMWATFSSVEDKEIADPPKQETVKTYEDTLDEAEQIDLAPEVLEDCEGLNLTVSLVDKTHYKARCPYVMKPEYVVIHNAATPNGTAKSLCVCQNKTVNREAELKSWHFSVDEDSVWESLPLNRNGFHASDGANGDGNRKGIAIEIARDLDGEEQYYQSAENRGALLAAVLLNKYGWDTSHLKTHHDFAIDGKWCPHKILDNGWDKFVAKVQSYLDEIQGKNIEEKPIQPAEPEIPKEEVKQDEEQVNVKQVNSLVSLLIKLVEKLLGIFK